MGKPPWAREGAPAQLQIETALRPAARAAQGHQGLSTVQKQLRVVLSPYSRPNPLPAYLGQGAGLRSRGRADPALALGQQSWRLQCPRSGDTMELGRWLDPAGCCAWSSAGAIHSGAPGGTPRGLLAKRGAGSTLSHPRLRRRGAVGRKRCGRQGSSLGPRPGVARLPRKSARK